MAHTYHSSLFHCVFSTKERRPLIHAEFREKLWAYLGGIARANNCQAIQVGGVADHVHILAALSSSISLAKFMQLLKGGSSKWVHDSFSKHRHFAWQEGYGAFSVGISQMNATIKYIANQAAHHRRQTFEEEFVAILNRHKIEFDPRYVWD